MGLHLRTPPGRRYEIWLDEVKGNAIAYRRQVMVGGFNVDLTGNNSIQSEARRPISLTSIHLPYPSTVSIAISQQLGLGRLR